MNTPDPVKPRALNRPFQKFVKRTGKKAMRWAAEFQGKQSRIPETPFIDLSHFPFLREFEDSWEAIRDEVVEILKFSDDTPGLEEVSPDQYRVSL